MSNALVAFLQARLDEDAGVAQQASAGPWTDDYGTIRGGPDGAVQIAQQVQAWQSAHITRHDPTRVLAEVTAKRRILDNHPITTEVISPGYKRGTGMGFGCETCHDWDGVTEGHGYCATLRLLAAPYSAHPDYRSEWAPAELC